MKKILFLSIATIGILNMAVAQVPCDRIVTISSDIMLNRTLYSDSIYRITGCVSVTTGNTLTIQAGTFVEFSDNSRLIILPGAKLDASGTALLPIVFTSAVGAPGSRTQVTNAGIIIAGKAITNRTTIPMPCSKTYTSGNDPTDNSGTMEYVQIHYLSGASTSDFQNALSLVGVGSATEIDHVEITNSGRNGLGILGGSPIITNLVTQDNYENGTWATYGTQAIVEGYLENRKNPDAHYLDGSNGIKIENNLQNPSATPITHVYLTNASFLGPKLCNPSPLSNEFRDGIYIGNNAEAEIYNTVIAGQVRNGLFLDGVIAKTATNKIQFSYNSFYGNGNNFDASPSSVAPGWGMNGGCDFNMALWLSNGTDPCKETGNQLGSFTLGYDGSFCEDYCGSTFTPDFVLTNNTGLDAPNGGVYDDRGAVQFDNLYDWITVCPQDKVYCSSPAPSLNFAPNPTDGTTYAIFNSDLTGQVTISVINSVTGAVLRSATSRISAPGIQRVPFSMSGFHEGVYTVRVQIQGTVLNGKIVVK